MARTSRPAAAAPAARPPARKPARQPATPSAEARMLAAIRQAQIFAAFAPDGSLQDANEPFCRALGYEQDEIRGRHHGVFSTPGESAGQEHRAWWGRLVAGEHDAAQYRYAGKGGREVWLQASYSPVPGADGRTQSIVLLGSDISTQVQGAHDIARVLSALARGDLTQSVADDGIGSSRQMKVDANAAVDQLNHIMGQIREATEAIHTAAVEIASGNADLSQRTEEQASSLEETASSMEELTSTVKQNADNARQANQLAATASEVALKGGQVVSQVVTTMSSINESSKKIVDIISVIDGIAFQTNILALNAAVEAARAGEQGRGFAVVAAEVRSLAQRSAEAAKEIKGLIGDSVDKVQTGTQLVAQAGSTIGEIVDNAQKISAFVTDITTAAQEQSDGIGQVNTAVGQLDQMTQQNAALVEQSAAAAESLREQAGRLAAAVQVFRVAA